MNIEKFHNELAMRLGYERIVNNKRILISVEDSDDPWVILRMDGNKDIRFKASEKLEEIKHEMCDEIKQICDAVNQAYQKSINETFATYNGIR